MWLLLPVVLLLSVAPAFLRDTLSARIAQAFPEAEVTTQAPFEAVAVDQRSTAAAASALIQGVTRTKTSQAPLVLPTGKEAPFGWDSLETRAATGDSGAPEKRLLDSIVGEAPGSTRRLASTPGLYGSVALLQVNQRQEQHHQRHHPQQQQGQQRRGDVDHYSVTEKRGVREGKNFSLLQLNGKKTQQARHEERELSLHQQQGQQTERVSPKKDDSKGRSTVFKNEEDSGAEDEDSEVEGPEEETSMYTKQEQSQKSGQQILPHREETLQKDRGQVLEQGEVQPSKEQVEQAARRAETHHGKPPEALSQRVRRKVEGEQPKNVERPPVAEKKATGAAEETSVGPAVSERQIQEKPRSFELYTATKQAQKKGSSPYEEDLHSPGENKGATVGREEDEEEEEEEGRALHRRSRLAAPGPSATATAAAQEGEEEASTAAQGLKAERKAQKEAAEPVEESVISTAVLKRGREEADLVTKKEKGSETRARETTREGVVQQGLQKVPDTAPSKPAAAAESEAEEVESSGAKAAPAQPLGEEETAATAAPEEEVGGGEPGEEEREKTHLAEEAKEVKEEELEEGPEEEELRERLASRAGAVTPSPKVKREEPEMEETVRESPESEAVAEAPAAPVRGGAEKGISAPRKEEEHTVEEEVPGAAVPVTEERETKPEHFFPEAEEEEALLHRRPETEGAAGAEQPEAVESAVAEEGRSERSEEEREEQREEEEEKPLREAKPASLTFARGRSEAAAAAGKGAAVETRGPGEGAERRGVPPTAEARGAAAVPKEKPAGGRRAPAEAAEKEERYERPAAEPYAEEYPEEAEGLTLPGHPEEEEEEEEARPEAKKEEVEAAVETTLEAEAAAAESGACYSGRGYEAARRGLRLLRVVLSNRNFRNLEQTWCDTLLNKIDGPFSERDVEFLLRAAAVSAAASRMHKNFRFCIASARSSAPRVKEGDSVLHAAVAASKPRLVELLLQYGAFPNMETLPRSYKHAMRVGQRPLHYAVQQQTLENIENVLLLLQYGALIDSVDVRGRTPLMAAAEASGPYTGRFIALLIDKGADVVARDHAGLQALHYAAAADSAEAVEQLLLRGAAAAEEDIRGNTPLHYAAMFNAAKALRALLRHARNNYPDIDVVNESGKAAIHLAAAPIMMDGFPRRFLPPLALEELLLHHDANPTARDHEQNTPLMLAASEGYTQMAKALLQIADPAPESANMEGKTAFDLAVDRGREDVAQLLREATSGTTCTSVPKVRHATEYFSDSQYGTFLRVGDTVTYMCDKGFRMKGKPTLTCMTRDDLSEFIPMPPTCVESSGQETLLTFPLFYSVVLPQLLLGALTLQWSF